jgi:hypothetical protein
MSTEFFTMVNFDAKTMAMIDQANEILKEYSAQGFVLTREQVNRDLLARTARRVHRTWGGR